MGLSKAGMCSTARLWWVVAKKVDYSKVVFCGQKSLFSHNVMLKWFHNFVKNRVRISNCLVRMYD
jgi:hypothetical protein